MDTARTPDAIADTLVRRARDANQALTNGDIDTWLALLAPADDLTLMTPFGGPPTRRFDGSRDGLDALRRFFQSGTTDLEVVRTYASDDLAVLVAIERQHAAVGGLPTQDWSLRVTLVFRRDASSDRWRLVHRHADALVHGITLAQAARLARGDGS